MNKKAICTFATSTLLLGLVAASPAHADMGCPYGGSPNWQGVCDTTTEDGDSYFGDPVWIPEPEPEPEVEVEPAPSPDPTPSPAAEVDDDVSNNLDTELSLETSANPEVVTSPVIWGNGNRVSSTVNNVNTTNNSVINNILNKINASSGSFKVVRVPSGYVVIGDSGAEYLPYSSAGLDFSSFDEIGDYVDNEYENYLEGEYLEKEDLPTSLRRAVNRLPDSVSKGRSKKISRFLRDSESITENVCVVEGRSIEFLSRGLCVLEIPIGNNVYEHEIRVTK